MMQLQLIETEPFWNKNIYFGESDYMEDDDFDGQIDEVRMVNYQKRAFAGGLMLSKIVQVQTITIYNATTCRAIDHSLELKSTKDGSNTMCTTSGTLASRSN